MRAALLDLEKQSNQSRSYSRFHSLGWNWAGVSAWNYLRRSSRVQAHAKEWVYADPENGATLTTAVP